MLRTILAVLFAVCYLIIGIPVLFVEWLIGKKNPHLRDISSLRMVQWAFRVICRICGVKLTVKGQENVPKDIPVLYVANHNSYFDILFCCGTLSEELAKGAQRGHTKVMYFADREKLTQTLINFVEAGDTVLVKASHFMEFPKIVKALEEALEA